MTWLFASDRVKQLYVFNIHVSPIIRIKNLTEIICFWWLVMFTMTWLKDKFMLSFIDQLYTNILVCHVGLRPKIAKVFRFWDL